MINTKSEPYGSRFQQTQYRPAQEEQSKNQQIQGSRKRSRSHERPHNVPVQQIRGGELVDGYDIGQAGAMSEGGREDLISPGKFESESDGAETTTESPTHPSKLPLSQTHQNSQAADVDSRLLPDYDDNELRTMSYAQLKTQTWEEIPHEPVFELPEDIRGPEVKLANRIQHYIDIKTPEERHQLLFDFFQQMPTTEWEQAGAFFVEKFAGFMKDIVAIRQEKRQLIETFEAEIEAREKAVRGKFENFEARFRTMKATGQQVLRGKMV
jgi:hypothetical protein